MYCLLQFGPFQAGAVGVVRGTKDGDEEDEEGRLPDFAGQRVGHRHRRAGVIDKPFLARRVGLAQAERQPANPGALRVAEPAVLIAVQVFALVLLPEQVECHSFSAQFAQHARPVGFRPAGRRGCLGYPACHVMISGCPA